MEDREGSVTVLAIEGGERMARFNELRDMVRSGLYEVPARAVAEAFLKRISEPEAGWLDGWNDLDIGGAI